MSVKLLSESRGATITDEDQARIEKILSFWFKEQQLTAPQIDRRMDTWFGEDAVFDHEIEKEFGGDVESASQGQLDYWADDPRGRLALILLIDQFRRNIHRNTEKAFSLDKLALKLCVEGAMEKKDTSLTPIQRVFFYMPLHQKLAESVSPTFRETFETVAQFAELHRDIIDQFGRFPHRNRLLGRKNTPEEDQYLAGDAPDFGQG